MFYSERRNGKLCELVLDTGESFRVRPGTLHRFSADFGDVVLLEVSTDHPEDVVRLEDDYNREVE
jgi:D-lyxose ketol-isomerase